MPQKITRPRTLTFLKKAVMEYPPYEGKSWVSHKFIPDVEEAAQLPLTELQQYGWPVIQLVLYRTKNKPLSPKGQARAFTRTLEAVEEVIPKYLTLLDANKDELISQLDALITTNRKD